MSENMDKVELNLDDLEQVIGGGALENLYLYYKRTGFASELIGLLPKGKKTVVHHQEPFLHSHVAELRQAVPQYNWIKDDYKFADQLYKDFAQKIYGML